MWHSSFHSLSLSLCSVIHLSLAFTTELPSSLRDGSKGKTASPVTCYRIYGQSNLQSSSSSHNPHLSLRSCPEGIGRCRGPYHSSKIFCGFWALEIPSEGREQPQDFVWSATSPFHSTRISEYSFVIVTFFGHLVKCGTREVRSRVPSELCEVDAISTQSQGSFTHPWHHQAFVYKDKICLAPSGACNS